MNLVKNNAAKSYVLAQSKTIKIAIKIAHRLEVLNNMLFFSNNSIV